MANIFQHRQTIAEEMFDFDAGAITTFPAGFKGSFISPDGPEGLEPAGDIEAPKWFLQYDLEQFGRVEMYGDGSVTQDYRLPVHVWAEAAMLEVVYRLAGAEVLAYLAALSVTGWTFRTAMIETQPGVAEVGGFAGRSFTLPVEAS